MEYVEINKKAESDVRRTETEERERIVRAQKQAEQEQREREREEHRKMVERHNNPDGKGPIL